MHYMWPYVVLLFVAMTAGCSSALLVRLGPEARPDIERAVAIAEFHQDVAGAACARAVLAALPAGQAPDPLGAFSAFMALREARRAISVGVSESVHNACAPLILDAEATIAKLGLAAVPGGGFLGGLFGR